MGRYTRNFNTSNFSSDNDNIKSSEIVDSSDRTESETSESIDNDEIKDNPTVENIKWDENCKYASFSKIHSGPVNLYRSNSKKRNNIIAAINAGHGTLGGSNIKTQCHPDGSPKVTGGSTTEGEVYAAAITCGMSFVDGTEESKVTLSVATIIKDKLLKRGYDVLMLREKNDCQLDNIARTVFVNENADRHIFLHYDASDTDKVFFILVCLK